MNRLVSITVLLSRYRFLWEVDCFFVQHLRFPLVRLFSRYYRIDPYFPPALIIVAHFFRSSTGVWTWLLLGWTGSGIILAGALVANFGRGPKVCLSGVMWAILLLSGNAFDRQFQPTSASNLVTAFILTSNHMAWFDYALRGSVSTIFSIWDGYAIDKHCTAHFPVGKDGRKYSTISASFVDLFFP
jgi:hypothetical protein